MVKIASLAALAMASSLKPFKDDSRVTPQQQAAAEQQPYKSPETGWTQLKDRKGNPSDVYLEPAAGQPPAGRARCFGGGASFVPQYEGRRCEDRPASRRSADARDGRTRLRA